ncbi:hypothetical protein HWB90_gp004 [Mycobacterium phage Fowlmouth]|uniref:Membrane protein n=2 Tax=Fowlmouthvirus fowlmouth TaxID=2845652 RepID=A0A7G8LPP7_9CAUD|nr:hypothetical protein HWB90_gp004 [Mycobacterium phage Fowlmouth]AYN57954.1 hypothetical protein SEA_FOWLMOUTH_4 [Mycobacterium phage Fowlmouth]QNJ59219.1 membrane protein [Mycobacterium phage MrMiyagi]
MNSKVALWVWGIATIAWAILLVPSLLWWQDSLLWVIVMSWWANVASSAAAFLAAHLERKQDKEKEK